MRETYLVASTLWGYIVGAFEHGAGLPLPSVMALVTFPIPGHPLVEGKHAEVT